MGIAFGIDHHDGNPTMAYYNSLTALNTEWEDAPEEPKEYWYIDPMVCGIYCTKIKKDEYAFNKQIGNCFCFESKEEAEKAVERLRAWKRLKDKGFEIYNWDYEFDMVDKPAQTIVLRASAVASSNTDLDLLFGGEE